MAMTRAGLLSTTRGRYSSKSVLTVTTTRLVICYLASSQPLATVSLYPPQYPQVQRMSTVRVTRSRAHVHVDLIIPVEQVSFATPSRRRNHSSIYLQSLAVEGDDGEAVPETASSKKVKTIKIETPTHVVESQATTPKSPRARTKPKLEAVTPSPNPKKKAPRKSPTKKTLQPGSLPPPLGWESIYSLVEELRQDRSAPVDSDGSEALPQHDLGETTRRFQILIALMLSSQTKDAVVGETIRGLQEYGLTVDNLAQTSPTKLNELIRKVGFHNNKTKYIGQVVEILQTKYDGDIPPTATEMMELPGIGPKMAFIIESVAWGNVTGIGVDTHMHRMLNELKWVTSKNPEQTRLQLQAWLPREKWGTINLVWVGFGQEVQQFKSKLLRKALDCSRPVEALKLVKRLGLDYNKQGAKLGITEEIQKVLEDAKGN
jgi:endonuclease-3